jgi:hypothetical protein
MKQFLTCISGIALIMMFAITSTVYGAAPNPKTGVTPVPNAGTTPAAFKNLPSTIKINPIDVKVKLVDPTSAQFKADWQKMTNAVADVNTKLPLLDQKIALLNTKIQECTNKSYTQADMTAAGCDDDMTVKQCSNELYAHCVWPSWLIVSDQFQDINSSMGVVQKFLNSSFPAFGDWYLNVEHQFKDNLK